MLISQAMRRRRRVRWVVLAGLSVLALCVLLDHLGLFGYPGDDWARFDQKHYLVSQVLAGDTVCVVPMGSKPHGAETTVHLLGLVAPHWRGDGRAEQAREYLGRRILNQVVTLRLETLGPRDAGGQLRAYLYTSDDQNLNLAIIREGQAYVDRHDAYSFRTPFQLAESEARRKHRGIWQTATTIRQDER